MPSDWYRVRVIVAKEEGHPWPMVVAAMPEDTWEVVPPEEWDAWKRKACESLLGPDWTTYDFAEAVVSVQYDDLRALFQTKRLIGTVAEPKDEPTDA